MVSRSVIQPWLTMLIGLLLVGPAGCGRSAATTLTIMAASSLTEAFQTMARQFEADQPGVVVSLSTAGSQALRVQIEHGAPGDVFASADLEHMQAVVTAGAVRDPQTFARTSLALVVPAHNPAGIESFQQLPRARRLVLGAPQVPVGRYTRRLLDRAAARYGDDFRAQVEAATVSLEPNVRQVRAKVELGEADAAIVYRSDVTTTRSRSITAIPIPPSLAVQAEYTMGVLTRSEHPELARAWIDFAASPAGQSVLELHGFEAP